MNVYLLWVRIEGGDSRMGYDSSEEVLEGVFATRKAAKDATDEDNTYRIERRKVKE
jgi:hypothetical protein